MQIIDGYCDGPNIFADDIGEYNTAIWGTRDCVLPAGERLGYELISNNEINIGLVQHFECLLPIESGRSFIAIFI